MLSDVNILLGFYLIYSPFFQGDFRCKDGQERVAQPLVCNGHPDCTDGSDEMDCPVRIVTRNATPLKCRLGSKLCKDGSDCVLYSHVCDGEFDCRDGSDEEGCDHFCKKGKAINITSISHPVSSTGME